MSTYPCSLCSSDFVAPSEILLLNHIRLAHSYDQNFSIQCSFRGCARVFNKTTVCIMSFQFPSDDSAYDSTGVEDLLGHSNPVEHCSGVRLMSGGGDSSSIEGAARAAGAADSPERSSARCCAIKDGSESCVFSMSSVFLAVSFLRFFLLNRPRLKRFL